MAFIRSSLIGGYVPLFLLGKKSFCIYFLRSGIKEKPFVDHKFILCRIIFWRLQHLCSRSCCGNPVAPLSRPCRRLSRETISPKERSQSWPITSEPDAFSPNGQQLFHHVGHVRSACSWRTAPDRRIS